MAWLIIGAHARNCITTQFARKNESRHSCGADPKLLAFIGQERTTLLSDSKAAAPTSWGLFAVLTSARRSLVPASDQEFFRAPILIPGLAMDLLLSIAERLGKPSVANCSGVCGGL